MVTIAVDRRLAGRSVPRLIHSALLVEILVTGPRFFTRVILAAGGRTELAGGESVAENGEMPQIGVMSHEMGADA